MNRNLLPGSVYQHYVYSYPHKSAYRRLPAAIPLNELWKEEDRSSLFLYLHIPFCEFRCGFCNLFTRAIPPEDLPDAYLDQLEKEAEIAGSEVGVFQVARMAIGGGTPTFLDVQQIQRLFEITKRLGGEPGRIPTGIECSPATLSRDKLDLLDEIGTERISIGIQSFSERICRSLGRPHDGAMARQKLDWIREKEFRCLNVDLIYGAEGQSSSDFCDSVREVLRWRPEEVFLYPLYVRPMTGLGNQNPIDWNSNWDEERLSCYRAGRDLLLAAGYRQCSMRMFRRVGERDIGTGQKENFPDYSCQLDGMLGLGCGARSYTRRLHYSTEYAVGRKAVHAIIDDYVRRPADNFQAAVYGFELNSDEQMRRFALMSLLHVDGLNIEWFEEEFGMEPRIALPQLNLFDELGLIEFNQEVIYLTESGLERSDQIGPALFSTQVSQQMEDYVCV